MSTDLELATADELLGELAKRFPLGSLFAGLKQPKTGTDQEDICIDYQGGLTVCIGLAERAKGSLLYDSVTGTARRSESEEDA